MTNDLVKRLRDSRYDGQLMMRVAAADRIEEMDAIFDLRWECDRRAIKQWQEAHPGNDRTWPDGADLCVWLMERVEELERHVELRDWFLVENDLWERFAKGAEGKKNAK